MAKASLRELLEASAAAYKDDDFEGAASFAARACRLAPDSLDAWDFHSLACQALGDPLAAERSCKKAVALLRKARERNLEDDKLALREVLLLIRLGRDDEIELLFNDLRRRHPKHGGLERLMASWRMRQR